MARSWDDVRSAADLDEARVATRREQLDEVARAYRLADVRRRQHLTQEQVASVMGVRQPRVSQLETGDLSHLELATLRAYVSALGGRLRVIAEFGDEHLPLSG